MFFSLLIKSQSDTLLKIFRTAQIKNNKKLSLQANIDPLKDVTIKSDGEHYYLKKDSYNIVDSIGIEVNAAKQIIALSFLYGYDTAYVHELRKYQKLMNSKGQEYLYYSKNKSIKVTKWEDQATIFELTEVIIDGKRQVYSVLFDSELYMKKFKERMDLRKNENSIELLKRLGLI